MIKKIHCLLIVMVLTIVTSCSDDSTGTIGPDGSNPTKQTIEIQGIVSGPLIASGKALSDEHGSLSDSSSTDFNSEIYDISTDGKKNSPLSLKASLSGELPMPNINVSIYELSDYLSNLNNASLLASTTTDSEGNYSVSEIEEGIDIVIVTDSNPRQTLIIINSENDSQGDLNSATAIVSEYWAGEIANGRTFDQSDFDEMLQTAEDLLEIMSADELYGVLVELVPKQFGDGFPENLSIDTQFIVNSLLGFDSSVCEAIIFDETAGKPTNYVLVEGLSEDFGQDPLAWVYDSEDMDEDNRHGVYIERLSGNEAELLIPLHPGNYLEGGSAVIVIYNEDQSIICPGISFEIEALKPAPGTIDNMVDNMENALTNWANSLGYSVDELLEVELNDLPDIAKPAAIGLLAIQGESFPNNMRALLHGDAPILSFYDDHDDDENFKELSDAIFAQSGFADAMNSISETISNFEASEITQSNGKSKVINEEPTIWTPERLNREMGFQEKFESLNKGAARAARDLGGAVIGTIGITASITGAVPVVALAGVAGLNLTMMQLIVDMGEGGLPSELQGLDLIADPIVYNEDDTTEGSWDASIEAKSMGFILNWPTVLGAMPGVGSFSRVLKKIPAAEELAEFTLSFLQSFLTEAWNAHDGSGPIELDPKTYKVEIDPSRSGEDQYFTWELRTQQLVAPFIFTIDEKGYIPEAAGISELRVRTVNSAFKRQDRVNNVMLEVQDINVTIGTWIGENIFTDNESPYYLDVQQELSLYADVRNAINKDVKWSVSPDESGLSILEFPGRDNVVEVIATEPGRYTVEAESIADTGPRADKTPRRSDQVTIVVGGLNVSNPGCVETGDTYQLTASIGGESIDFSELEWDINGPGSIDSNGVYTAGGTGDVQIQFQVIDQPNLNESISFSVKEMCRSFSVNSSMFNFSGGECLFFVESVQRGLTTIEFNYNKIGPRAYLSITEALSDTMSPDDDWTVEQPPWVLVSSIRTDPNPINNWFTFTNENGEPSNFELSHELRTINGEEVRTLSGYFNALYHYIDSSGENKPLTYRYNSRVRHLLHLHLGMIGEQLL